MDGKKLKARIVADGLKVNGVAKDLGVSPQLLSSRLCGKSRVTLEESFKLKELLHLDDTEFREIFLP